VSYFTLQDQVIIPHKEELVEDDLIFKFVNNLVLPVHPFTRFSQKLSWNITPLTF